MISMQIALYLFAFALDGRSNILHHLLVVPDNFVVIDAVLLHFPFLGRKSERS
jgi:hypothetical protein